MATLSFDEFRALFHSAERSILRLESRGRTDVPTERPLLRAFLRGELPEVRAEVHDEWAEMVTRHLAAGRPFRRVRVMDDPLTAYNRFMIWTGQGRAGPGEDIRYLARHDANALDLPDHDFWVFDSAGLLELRFTDDGRPLDHDLITDPVVVARHEGWIHRGLASAIPSADYIAADPTRTWPPVRLDMVRGV